jgi:RNA polymerase-binding transcription factor DksA
VPAKKPTVVKKATPVKAAKPVVKAVAKKVVEKKAVAPKAKVEIKKPISVKTPEKKPFVPPKETKKPEVIELAVAPVAPHSDAFIQKQRQRLLDLRDELVDSMSGMTRDTIRNAPEGSEASGSGQHQGDAGSDAYDRDFALSVLAKEQDALYEIEEALVRIRKGLYGICELSNRKIPQARLEAIPFARLTVECQAQWEKEFGKRRFRPSNEVGFSGGKYADDEDSESVSLDEEED